MTSSDPVQRGNSEADYKKLATIAPSDESMQVKMWRSRIDRAILSLKIAERQVDEKIGNEYLTCKRDVKNGQVIYLNYLLPALEDAHRNTIPNIPTPRVEAKLPGSEQFAKYAANIGDLCIASPYSNVKGACKEVQWDDDRSGYGILKTVWERIKSPATSPATVTDPDQVAAHFEKATAENDDPMSAALDSSDNHQIHIEEHTTAASMIDPASPESDALMRHISTHEAQLFDTVREHPVLRRVPWWKFVFDYSLGWELRPWDAEERSVRVSELLDQHYKNLNPINCPAESDSIGGEVIYDDMTVKVWDIHDRLTGKHYVISADGPEDGHFLFRGDWIYGSIDIYRRVMFRQSDPDRPFGDAAIKLATPILDRLAAVDFHIDRHVSMHSDYKYPYIKGSMTDDTKAALNDPNQQFVPFSPEAAAGRLPDYNPKPIPVTLLQQRESLLNELRRILASDAISQGADTPHQITATEAGLRGNARSQLVSDRQTVIADALAWAFKNFLSMYKKFATLNITVRILGPMGAEFKSVNPTDIPDELDVSLDIRGESDDGRIEYQLAAEKLVQLIVGLGPGTYNVADLVGWYGRATSAHRNAESFLAPVPQLGAMPGALPGIPGQPGMPSDGTGQIPGQMPPQMPQQIPQMPQAAGMMQ